MRTARHERHHERSRLRWGFSGKFCAASRSRGWRVRYFGPRVATTTMTSLMTFQTPPAPLAPGEIERVVRAALDEDAAGDDVTTRWTVPAEAVARAEILFRQAGVVAGSSV